MTAGLPTLVWARRPLGRVLASPRAVALWRRWLAGAAGRASRIRRLAAWLQALTAPPPSLLQDELFGVLPATVTELDEGSGGRGRTSGRTGRSEVDGSAARAGRAHDGTPGRRRRLSPADLVPEQGAARAGAAVELPRASVRRRRPLPDAAASSRGNRTKRNAQVVSRGRERHAPTLADVVTGRAARRLVAAATPASPELAGPEPAAGETTSRSAEAPGLPDVAAGARDILSGQWTSPLAGRSAPPELLLRLLARRRDGVDFPGSSSSKPAPAAPLATPTATTEAGTRAVEAASVAGARNGSPTPDAVSATVVRTPALPTQSPPPLATAPQGGEANEPLHALAADVPAQGLGPRAEAAARMRLIAAEEGPHGAGLDTLAAKVKRILDEEARRHGIDV